jgi:hypothetical protein
MCEGTWLKTARVFDELWQSEPLQSPAQTIEVVRTSGLAADLFTFAQFLPHTTPHYDYHVTWDNLAVAETTNFEAWWEGLPQESRKNVRKCQKRGVTIRAVEFNDELIAGIKAIYDETPVRQGRRFWHYGKDFAAVKRENSSYVERSRFIGAFIGNELVGFIKLVFVGRTARIMQILSQNAHYDKHPMNALLASSVEYCAGHGIEHLIYGQYVYGNKRRSSVTEFKRRNGFHEVLLPRYYIPFTWKGSLAIAAGLYRTFTEMFPEPVISAALKARNIAYKQFPRMRSRRLAASAA